MPALYQILNTFQKNEHPDFYQSRVPSFINANLKERFGERAYQQEAFGRFVFFWNEYNNRPKGVPVQLLYHMATGSGKTLIMAGLIIYLYSKGYRNFLFFVNSSNIIDKTRDNFLNPVSSKYLFAETISIGNKQVHINEVDNFQAVAEDDINIVFSTIQGLHSRLNTPKENSITYDDFEDKKIVLISDEAHHINADTKKGNDLYTDEVISWEGTVNRVLHANRENILLEFTATADLSVTEIEKKYSDKLVYDYSLKQFRKDGYSKEVKVLQADMPVFERALQSVVLSQYRKKLFEKNSQRIKPVILFKSRTIKGSQAFFKEFADNIRNLKASDLEKIKLANHGSILEKAFYYFEINHILFDNLVTELKEDFSEDNLISVNSKEESEQKQIAVNSLEDEANQYRAVFVVDKLNEGWDVLNLFDIVRLYDTKDTREGKPGKTTMSEAQLIGRGARYCPFQTISDQPYASRKFDNDLTNELRICEELFYHSAYNPQYIRELKSALEEIGIKPKEAEEKSKSFKKNVQEPFIHVITSSFFKAKMADQKHKVVLKTRQISSGIISTMSAHKMAQQEEQEYKLSGIGGIFIRKAMSRIPFYQFSNLKKILPGLSSVSEFILSPDYIGSVTLTITGLPKQVSDLLPEEKLEICIQALQSISTD
jgi:type III restriction enzyme